MVFLIRPPESVISGDSTPRENEKDDVARRRQRTKEIIDTYYG